jgi:hypothetical protein
MADAESAYGADSSVVNWTLKMNCIGLGTSLVLFTAISTSRSFNSNGIYSKIFSIRRHLHPMSTHPEPKNVAYFDWIKAVWDVSDEDYLMTSGLDALMTTKFHIALCKICFLCSIYGLAILCPVHYSGETLDKNNDECKEEWDYYRNATSHGGGDDIGMPTCLLSNMYSKLTMANINATSDQVYFDIVGLYLFTVIACYYLYDVWKDYVKYRHIWLARPVTENQSILVDHIPLHLRSNHGLYTFFDTLFPDQVASVSIVLDVKGLDTLIKLREKTASQLDYALASYAKSKYKVRPTFVFHNWTSRLKQLCGLGPSKTNPNASPLRNTTAEGAEYTAGGEVAQTPLLEAVDATNNRLDVGVTPLTNSSAPPYGAEVDSIEYYQILLEQYNDLVETKQQEFICWHAWHEQQKYRDAEASKRNSFAEETSFVEGEEEEGEKDSLDGATYETTSRLTLTPTPRSSLAENRAKRSPTNPGSSSASTGTTPSRVPSHLAEATTAHEIYLSSSSKSLTPARSNRARSALDSPVSPLLPADAPALKKSNSSYAGNNAGSASNSVSGNSSVSALRRSHYSSTTANSSEFQLISRAQPRYIREAQDFAAATEAMLSGSASVSQNSQANSQATEAMSLKTINREDEKKDEQKQDTPGGDDLDDGFDFEQPDFSFKPGLSSQMSQNSADSELSDGSSSGGNAYSSLYSSLRGGMLGEAVSKPDFAPDEDSKRNRLDTENERNTIHTSIRGLVKKEKSRYCCCCIKMPSGNMWKKLPLQVNGLRRKSMFTKDQHRLKHLKWMAQSVVDKTIETIIGNPMSSTGFVTFTSLTAASIACNSSVYPDPLAMSISPAPAREEVIWENLERTIRRRFIKHVTSIGFAGTVVVLFAVPTTFISGALSATQLQKYWPSLDDFVQNFPYLGEGLAFIAPLLIMILVICMPPIFSCCAKLIWRSERSITGLHQHVFQRYFLLLFYNVFIIIVVSSTFLQNVNTWTGLNLTEVLTKIGQGFPLVSNFYLDYLAIKIGCGLPMELLRVACFFQAGIKAIFCDDLTAQQRDAMVIGCRSLGKSGGFYFGRFLAEHCLIFVLVFTYSVVAPIILPAGCIFFGFAALVYKRNLLWVYEPELNAGGEFWPQCFRRAIWALVSGQLAVICMMVLLTKLEKLTFVFFLPPVTVLYSKYLQRIYAKSGKTLPLTTAISVDEMVNEDFGGVANRAEMLRDAYTQPSLVAETEPVFNRGDGGWDRSMKNYAYCCPVPMMRVRGSNIHTRFEVEAGGAAGRGGGAPKLEPPERVARRVTRGLSYGRLNSSLTDEV